VHVTENAQIHRPCYVGQCSNRPHRRPRYMYRNIWMETSWFLMKKTTQTKQPSTQTNRQTAHNRHVVSSNRSYTSQKRDTQTTQHVAISSIAVRRNTAWDARNVYLNIMYFNISHRRCNLAEKSLTTSHGADCDTDKQTD